MNEYTQAMHDEEMAYMKDMSDEDMKFTEANIAQKREEMAGIE